MLQANLLMIVIAHITQQEITNNHILQEHKQLFVNILLSLKYVTTDYHQNF